MKSMDVSNPTASASISAASVFLAPVLTRGAIEKAQTLSIIDRLAVDNDKTFSGVISTREAVIRKALNFLDDIHRSLALEENESTINLNENVNGILYDPRSRRIIYGLLDLVSVEGIYPSLSPGVGIPIERRVRSVLPAGVVVKPVPSVSDLAQGHERILLAEVIDRLSQIAGDVRKGLKPVLRERTLVDIICGSGELAFGPSADSKGKSDKYKTILKKLLDDTATPVLLPLLTSLLQPSIPTWLRPQFSVPLSLLLLRPNGVRQTIEFIATTYPTPPPPLKDSRDSSTSNPPQGPPIPLEAITQASDLLASVPSSITPKAYFQQLAPQLFQLLDGDSGPELSKAAGMIIGGGILVRRNSGALRVIGWEFFALPLLRSIDPRPARSTSDEGDDKHVTAVSEIDLSMAIQRLSKIIFSHPNPNITNRLLGPLIRSLWGLLCYAKRRKTMVCYTQISTLLQTYFKVSAGAEELLKLAKDLLWDGRNSWTFGPGSEGGVEIRPREPGGKEASNMIEYVEEIDERVNEFVHLLSSANIDDTDLGRMFLSTSRLWLLGAQDSQIGRQTLDFGRGDDSKVPLEKLINAKLVQKMLEEFKDKLAGKPTQIFELVKQLLHEYVEQDQTRERKAESLKSPSYAALGNIVQQDRGKGSKAGDESKNTPTQEDPTELASIAVSLLSTILSSPDYTSTPQDIALLSTIQPSLSYLSTSSPSNPSSLSIAAKNLSYLLSLHRALPPATTTTTTSHLMVTQLEDRKSYQQALTYLTDALPPVRVQGLALLTKLIGSRSSILDIPSTAILLISLLQDDDEFIYLNAVKTLSVLASTHSKTTVKMLVERYVDGSEESSLDQRLRLGEALLRTVEGLGRALVEESASRLGEGMIAVAGRRAKRPKELDGRKNRIRQDQGRQREAEEAWGGKVPQIDEEEGTVDVETNRLADIVERWEGEEGEEDVRIRASALSILGQAIETNVAGLGSELTSTAIDLALSILTLEKSIEKMILRRAAVLLIMSLLKALDTAYEEGRKLGFGFAGENLADVVRILRYIEATDNDDLVKGHAATVIEGLEIWRSKSVLGVRSSERAQLTPSLALSNEKLAGLSVNPMGQSGSRPRIEEVE
ncbi:MAG: hypothetical protein M1827_002550 [Pycnora praestabilis]|nr:MAG: hypothetical protein M1827_002550 [Pycnora praestabilis]